MRNLTFLHAQGRAAASTITARAGLFRGVCFFFAVAAASQEAPATPAPPATVADASQARAPANAEHDKQQKEKVAGIGGFFFRSRDPKALAKWYEQYLGITLTPTDYGKSPWQQGAGPTVFQPFPSQTDYFGSPDKQWMINFRVADLDAMVRQLKASNIEVKVDPTTYPNGRFARLHDPEGNAIELWEPKNSPASPNAGSDKTREGH